MNTMIFRDMSYGVYVTTSLDGNRPVGCITNSIMQITSDPATIAVSVNHNNYTNSCLDKSGKFAVSILSENSDPSLIGTFGFQSSKENDKFEGVDYELAAGLPVIKDSCGYVVCRVIDTMETETHTVFLGDVIEAESYGKPDNAMTYAYYHKVVKGKAPKNAPTYLPEVDGAPVTDGSEAFHGSEALQGKKTGKWVCQVCGYVYEGDELPADFKCPVCGQGADKFKKVE